EQKILADIVRTLEGLSQEQMSEVLSRLDAAVRAPDPAAADKELAEAYARHREVINTLRGLLTRYDALRDLAQLADKLDKLAKQQLDLHLETARFIKNQEDRTSAKLDVYRRMGALQQDRSPLTEGAGPADEQSDVQKELSRLLDQGKLLKSKVPAAEQERLGRMQKLAADQSLHEGLTKAALGLRLAMRGAKTEQWREANELQARAATQIQELARALRAPLDQAAALREARDRIDQAIARQKDLHEKTQAQNADVEKDAKPEANENLDPSGKPALQLPGLTPMPIAGKPSTVKAQRAANQEQAAKEMAAAQ